MDVLNAPFLTANEVGDYLRKQAIVTNKYNMSSNQEFWRAILKDLEDKESAYKKAEEEVYSQLNGINNIQELQERLDSFKAGAEGLTAGGFSFDIPAYAKVDLKTVAERVLKQPEVENGSVELAASPMLDLLAKSMKATRVDKAEVDHKKLSIFLSKVLEAKEYGEIPSSVYKHDIAVALSSKKGKDIFGQIDVPNFPDVPPLQKGKLQYPFFVPSIFGDEQKQAWIHEMLTNNEYKDLFINQLKSLVTDNKIKSLISNIINELGVNFFIVSDEANARGRIGELYALLFMRSIAKPNNNVEASGQLKNILRDKAELGADVVLNGLYGIQVKQYRSTWGGYHLKKDYTWQGLLEKRHDQGIMERFGEYLVVREFNKPDKQGYNARLNEFGENQRFVNNYKQYEQMYEAINGRQRSFNESFNNYLAATFGEVFTIEEAYKFEEGLLNGVNEGDYKNVFWMFGGKYIIPTSAIIKTIRLKLQQAVDAQTFTNQRNLMRASVSYRGSQHWTYDQFFKPNTLEYDTDTDAREKLPSAMDILSNMHFFLDLTIMVSEIVAVTNNDIKS